MANLRFLPGREAAGLIVRDRRMALVAQNEQGEPQETWSRLPADLMNDVFAECAHAHAPEDGSYRWILPVAHISRSWRRAALRYGYVPVDGPPAFVDAILECCEGARLTLQGMVTRATVDTTLKCLQLTDQFYRVELHVERSQISRIAEEAWYPASRMETLAIYKLCPNDGDEGVLPRELDFFRADTPKLLNVTICGFNVNLQSGIFEKLKTLRLEGDDAVRLPPCNHLLQALKRCPRLETLVISGLAPALHQGFPQRAGLTNWVYGLAKLRHLEVKDKLSATAHLLSHLKLPSCHRIELDIHATDEELQNNDVLITNIANCLNSMAMTRRIGAVLLQDCPGADGFSLQYALSGESLELSESGFIINIRGVEGEALVDGLIQAAGLLMGRLNIIGVYSLEITHSAFKTGNHRPEFWKTAFPKKGMLQKLRTRGQAGACVGAAARDMEVRDRSLQLVTKSLSFLKHVEVIQLVDLDLNDWNFGRYQDGASDLIKWYNLLRKRLPLLRSLGLFGRSALDQDEKNVLRAAGITTSVGGQRDIVRELVEE